MGEESHVALFSKRSYKNDCDRIFTLLKRGLDGLDIWAEVELDEALKKKTRHSLSYNALQGVIGRC